MHFNRLPRYTIYDIFVKYILLRIFNRLQFNIHITIYNTISSPIYILPRENITSSVSFHYIILPIFIIVKSI